LQDVLGVDVAVPVAVGDQAGVGGEVQVAQGDDTAPVRVRHGHPGRDLLGVQVDVEVQVGVGVVDAGVDVGRQHFGAALLSAPGVGGADLLHAPEGPHVGVVRGD